MDGQRPPPVEPLDERRRWRTATAAHAQTTSEILQRPTMPLDGETTVQTKGLCRHRGGDRRIAVAGTADPPAEGQPPTARRRPRPRREPGIVRPARARELRRDARQRVPEDRVD